MPATYDSEDKLLELKKELSVTEDALKAEFAAHGKTLAQLHLTEARLALSESNKAPVSVFVVYYTTGFTDDSSQVVAVCDSNVTANAALEHHKQHRDRRIDYKDKAEWWTVEYRLCTASNYSRSVRFINE
jgi:hypothetical protein